MTDVIRLTIPTPFNVGPVNAYIVKGDALTLVDCGPRTKEAREALINELKKHNFTINDLDQIVLTHHHEDHVGLLEWILEQKHIPVLGHPDTELYLQDDSLFMQNRKQFFKEMIHKQGAPSVFVEEIYKIQQYLRGFGSLGKLTHPLHEDDRLPGGEMWRVLYTPGHAPDHLSLYNEQTNEMIAGDHLIKHIASTALIEPDKETFQRFPALIKYRQSLKNLLNYPIKTVYSGHGEAIPTIKLLIEGRLRRQVERAEEILTHLHRPLSAFEISEILFPRHYIKEFPLTLSEVVGHLDLLIENDKVVVEDRDGVLFYCAV